LRLTTESEKEGSCSDEGKTMTKQRPRNFDLVKKALLAYKAGA
jgi:hypothetical protein